MQTRLLGLEPLPHLTVELVKSRLAFPKQRLETRALLIREVGIALESVQNTLGHEGPRSAGATPPKWPPKTVELCAWPSPHEATRQWTEFQESFKIRGRGSSTKVRKYLATNGKPEWRNWQTRWTQNPVRFTPRVGSTPTSGTMFSIACRHAGLSHLDPDFRFRCGTVPPGPVAAP